MVGTVSNDQGKQPLPGVRGMILAEIPVPASFFGRTVGSLGIRNRFGVSLLLIKRREEGGDRIIDDLPAADSVLHEGDVMLVLGSEDRISRFEKSG